MKNNINEIKRSVTKFNTLSTALNYSNKTIKPTLVVVGDDNKYWICTGKQWEVLKANGFKIAK